MVVAFIVLIKTTSREGNVEIPTWFVASTCLTAVALALFFLGSAKYNRHHVGAVADRHVRNDITSRLKSLVQVFPMWI
jgi:hypothetical protein